MPESQGAHLEVLTDAEREALERPGLRTRSKAIIAATELATKIGLAGDIQTLLVERLRELDKADAKLAWQTLGDMNELLQMLSVDVRALEPGESTPLAIESTPPQVVVVEQLAGSAAEPKVEEYALDVRKVRNFYTAINKKTQREWVTVPRTDADVDADELMALVALYAADHYKPRVAARMVDKIVESFDPEHKASKATYGLRSNLSKTIAELLDGLDAAPVVEAPHVAEEPVVPNESHTEDKNKLLSVEETLERLTSQEGRESTYNIERVERMLDQLRREGVDIGLTAEDFSHEVLKQLAIIYSKASTTAEEMVMTNIACTWGWLSDVDMEDLILMRRSTKADASAPDVHNSKAAFVNGVIKGWRKGMRLELSEDEVSGEEEHAEDHVTLEHEPLHSVPPVEDEAEAGTPTVERSIDEEPEYVQIVDAYIEKLDLSVNRRAFEELLNPQTRGEMTSAKTLVIESLRNRVGNVSPDGSVINELDVAARAKSALRRMLGMGFVKHGNPEERASEPLREQLRSVGAFDHQGYANDLYSALAALLDALTSVEPEPVESVADSGETIDRPKVFQVDFSGGEARLVKNS